MRLRRVYLRMVKNKKVHPKMMSPATPQNPITLLSIMLRMFMPKMPATTCMTKNARSQAHVRRERNRYAAQLQDKKHIHTQLLTLTTSTHSRYPPQGSPPWGCRQQAAKEPSLDQVVKRCVPFCPLRACWIHLRVFLEVYVLSRGTCRINLPPTTTPRSHPHFPPTRIQHT